MKVQHLLILAAVAVLAYLVFVKKSLKVPGVN